MPLSQGWQGSSIHLIGLGPLGDEDDASTPSLAALALLLSRFLGTQVTVLPEPAATRFLPWTCHGTGGRRQVGEGEGC